MTIDLGNRMEEYEQAEAGRRTLKLLPVLVRLDGKNFSRFTKKYCEKPFDDFFAYSMHGVLEELMKYSSAKFGYTQSDEITLLLYSDDYNSQIYFDGKIQKIGSVLAALASVAFNDYFTYFYSNLGKICPRPIFDARVWTVPNIHEATNVFLWRERDAQKNSISNLAIEHFSDKELNGVDQNTRLEMLRSKGIIWEDLKHCHKYGLFMNKSAEVIKLSPFNTCLNRVGVIFENEKPIWRNNEK